PRRFDHGTGEAMKRLGLPVALLVAGCVTGAPQKPPTTASSGATPGAATGPGSPEALPQKDVEPAASAPARLTPDAAYRQQAPAAGPEPTFRPPPWKRFKLKNGLDVFLVEFHDLPLVDFNLMIKTGGAANPADKAGLADLTAKMLDEGT